MQTLLRLAAARLPAAGRTIRAAAARSPTRKQDQESPDTPLGAFSISLDFPDSWGENPPTLSPPTDALQFSEVRDVPATTPSLLGFR